METGIETVIWQAVITVSVAVAFALFGVAVVGWLLRRGMRKIQLQNSHLMHQLAGLNQEMDALGEEVHESHRKRKEISKHLAKRYVEGALESITDSVVEGYEAIVDEQMDQLKSDFDGSGSS